MMKLPPCLLKLILVVLLASGRIHGVAQPSRLLLQSQREQSAKEAARIKEGKVDTMLHYSFPAVEIEAEYKFKNEREKKKYNQLFQDIKRTYPLSQIVKSEVNLVDAELDSVYTTDKKRKQYLKWYEKHIYHTYIDTLKALNVRQVKLFIKLVSRETGKSPYELIRHYRGSFDAFFWQFTANVLFVNLKNKYDPIEDAMIEDILNKFY
ncbi:MAG: DUF4294 domain-containing protein [Marinilabiliales bacterium]|nr:DUF4294 domain-containing protein [Marinilabiliales bacterium]